MAFNTFEFAVLSSKRIACDFVVEGVDLPTVHAVTVETATASAELGAQVPTMLVFVAGQTLLFESHEFEEAKALFLNFGLLFMAVETFAFGMLAFERVSR